MGEFEALCKERDIELWVLPPRRPQYNGSVERINATTKYEFYQFCKITSNLKRLNLHIEHYFNKYNTVRPHQALQYLTPREYFQNLEQKGVFHAIS